jgi:hypothetical protein
MPTRKPRRLRPKVSPKILVRLEDKERTRIGMTFLAMADGPLRTAALSDLERVLGLWASALANVPNVLLRSDMVSWTEPVALQGRTFVRAVKRLDRDIKTMASALGFVNFDQLRREIAGLNTFVVWVKKEASKRGGERGAIRKQVNDFWAGFLGEWFDRNTKASAASRAQYRMKLLRHAQRAVERAVRRSKSPR